MSGRSRWSTSVTRANGQLAFVHSRLGAAPDMHHVTLLTLRGPRIEAMTAFLLPGTLERFGG
jgi:hypothetical protein